MIVRPMRSPDRGFITTEAGRDSNGSVFTECGNRQNTALVHCAGIEPTDLPVMSGVLWPTELAMRLSDAGAGLACRKAPKKHAIHGHRSIPSPYARGDVWRR